jgi:hypothetical protein
VLDWVGLGAGVGVFPEAELVIFPGFVWELVVGEGLVVVLVWFVVGFSDAL